MVTLAGIDKIEFGQEEHSDTGTILIRFQPLCFKRTRKLTEEGEHLINTGHDTYVWLFPTRVTKHFVRLDGSPLEIVNNHEFPGA